MPLTDQDDRIREADWRLPAGTIDLDEARARVGGATGVDPVLWAWKPGDVRWITGQWRLTKMTGSDEAFLRALRIIYPDPPRPWWSFAAEWLSAVGDQTAKATAWALFRSPPPVRVVAWLSGVFLFAFLAGAF